MKWNLLFFIAGFAFDVFATRAGVDHTLMIVQQVAYLAIIGGILYVDFVRDAEPEALPMPRWLAWLWRYRSFAFHFCLGTLMNLSFRAERSEIEESRCNAHSFAAGCLKAWPHASPRIGHPLGGGNHLVYAASHFVAATSLDMTRTVKTNSSRPPAVRTGSGWD